MQGSKYKGELHNKQIIPKEWLGDKPLIVNGCLRVVIDDVIYLPKLIKSIPIRGDKVWLVFKMGKDIFQSVGYDLIVLG
jgi:hypothetical protein